MKVKDQSKPFNIFQEETIGAPALLTTAEAAEVLRVSRRTIEELGKAYDRGMTTSPPGEPPPSCPRYGLRRTRITPRKQYYHRLDLAEYLKNCRRQSEGLDPIRLDPGVH